MSSTDPWRIKKVRSEWKHALSHPKPDPNTTIVVFEGSNCLGLLGPRTPLSKTGCARGIYRFHFIPLSQRTISLDENLPAEEIGVAFRVHVEVTYRVDNAEEIAKADPPDLDETVKAKVRNLVQGFAGQYKAENWLPLQQAIQQYLRGPRLGLGITIESSIARVEADRRVLEARQEAFVAGIEQDVTRAKAELEKVQVDTQAELAKIREQHRHDLLTMKMEFYAQVLRNGRFDQFALLLAENPDETKDVLAHFEEERNWVIRERWDLFKKWLFTDDAPLIASRIREFAEGLDLITPLGGDAFSPQLQSQPRSLLEEREDLAGLVETLEETDEIDESPASDET